jgi:hypothetical protein
LLGWKLFGRGRPQTEVGEEHAPDPDDDGEDVQK